MTMTAATTKAARPLSYSSANLLKSCSQRYYYYKVVAQDLDADFEDSTKAFDIGKAFHYILETNNHEDKNVGKLTVLAKATYDLEEDEALMVKGMVLKYLKLHLSSGLKAIKCELGLSIPEFIGYIDALMEDKEGLWWIVDLKTAARINPDTGVRLHRDTQLNLYAKFVPQICEILKLDSKKFGGIRYRVTTKSKAKRKATELAKDFVIRMANTVKSFDYVIPAKLLDPDAFYADHMDLYKKSIALHEGTQIPVKNFAACFNYFRPCPYWSKCHGNLFSNEVEEIECLTLD